MVTGLRGGAGASLCILGCFIHLKVHNHLRMTKVRYKEELCIKDNEMVAESGSNSVLV